MSLLGFFCFVLGFFGFFLFGVFFFWFGLGFGFFGGFWVFLSFSKKPTKHQKHILGTKTYNPYLKALKTKI